MTNTNSHKPVSTAFSQKRLASLAVALNKLAAPVRASHSLVLTKAIAH